MLPRALRKVYKYRHRIIIPRLRLCADMPPMFPKSIGGILTSLSQYSVQDIYAAIFTKQGKYWRSNAVRLIIS